MELVEVVAEPPIANNIQQTRIGVDFTIMQNRDDKDFMNPYKWEPFVI